MIAVSSLIISMSIFRRFIAVGFGSLSCVYAPVGLCFSPPSLWVPCGSFLGMALDSAASFAARVRDLGLGELLPRFEELGWCNMGTLAFSAGSPGAPSSEAAFDERVVIHLAGSSATPQAANIRRLYYEATTLAAADMRRRMDRVDDDTIPPLPTEEQEARRARLQARLIGVRRHWFMRHTRCPFRAS